MIQNIPKTPLALVPLEETEKEGEPLLRWVYFLARISNIMLDQSYFGLEVKYDIVFCVHNSYGA